MQIISNDKTVRSSTVQVLKEFNSQFLATQAKKGEQLVTLTPAIKKALDLMGDDIVEVSSKNEYLKKIGSYDVKWLDESKAKIFRQFDDEKRSKLILSGMEKKQY